MKSILNRILIIFAATLGMLGCSTNKGLTNEPQPTEVQLPTINQEKPMGGLMNYVPKAQIYRTNGNYNDNVPIQVSADGREIISFPAPTDLGPQSKPLPLADGYLLDRRGISPYNTRFTTYTYSQYAALPTAPGIAELLKSIIPAALVTDFIELPVTIGEAMADTAAVNTLIRQGFPGCTIILQEPALK